MCNRVEIDRADELRPLLAVLAAAAAVVDAAKTTSVQEGPHWSPHWYYTVPAREFEALIAAAAKFRTHA